MAPNLRGDTVRLFSALKSRDAIESILNRLLVAMNNSVMECHARAARTDNPKVVDTNLRHAIKGTRAIVDLVEARERRRSPTNVTVERVNVNAGGRAMVGNFEIRKEPKRESTPIPPPADNQETEG